MKKRKMIGLLLAGMLALSLLPMSAFAITGADLPKKFSDRWDYATLLSYGEDGMPTCCLIPSEFDAEHYRLVKAARSDGQEAQVEYDAQGNVTMITYTLPDEDGGFLENAYTWEYDSQGREVCYTSIALEYTVETAYNDQGLVASKTFIIDEDNSAVIKYTYDSQGRLTEQLLDDLGAPGVDTYTYEGDKLVKNHSVSDGVESETLYTYNDAGLLKEKTEARYDPAGDGTMKLTEKADYYYAYDEAGRMVNLKTDRFNSEGKRDCSDEYQWTYFQDGKLNKQEYAFELLQDDGSYDVSGKTTTIQYNSAGRVSSVDANGIRFVYTYDENGNNTKIAVTGDKDLGDYTYTFTYEPVQAQPVTPPAPAGFVDVKPDAYYAEPVAWAVEKGITTGTSETTFSPNDPCTRAQVVTFLWRAMGSPEVMYGTDLFTDVKPDAYYFKAVQWALSEGITSGTGDGKFSPNAPCTRAQVATFLWRALGKPETQEQIQMFFDVGTDAYYFDAVQWAQDRGVTSGTGDGKFSPNATCTRAQVVTFLYRALSGAE